MHYSLGAYLDKCPTNGDDYEDNDNVDDDDVDNLSNLKL